MIYPDDSFLSLSRLFVESIYYILLDTISIDLVRTDSAIIDLTFDKICHGELRMAVEDQKTLMTMISKFQINRVKEHSDAETPDERGLYSSVV